MTSDAIINGQTVILEDDEKEAAEKFHKKRLAFAWIHGKLTFNENLNDDRDHQHWLLEDFGISPAEWESIPRGYMLPGKIQLFIGSDFRKLDATAIPSTDFDLLRSKHYDRYGVSEINVYNGVFVGKVGDIWKPMEHLWVLKCPELST